jgi:hypothetical protein
VFWLMACANILQKGFQPKLKNPENSADRVPDLATMLRNIGAPESERKI